MKHRSIFPILGLLIMLALAGCEDNKGMKNQCSVDFDQQALFSSVLNDQIRPGYASLIIQLDELKQDFKTLQSDPVEGNLNALKSSFSETYNAWKQVEIFTFGPAEDAEAQSFFNFFPLNIFMVEKQLSSGFDPDNSALYDKGLPVLDYFIFHKSSPQDQLDYLTQPEVVTYFNQVLNKMRSVAGNIRDTYDNGFGEKFKTMTGTSAGTSLSLMVNALSKSFEDNRRDQLGIPSGAVTLNIPNPDKTEAYYSGMSLKLLQRGVETAEMLYEGSPNGLGIKDYLEALESKAGGEKVAGSISSQFDKILKAIPPIEEPLSKAVIEDKEDVAALYRAMSDQVIKLKTDLPSRLCISITYIDNPSDTD